MALLQQNQQEDSTIVKLLPIITVVLVIIYAAASYVLIFRPKLGQIVQGGAYDTVTLQNQLKDEASYLTSLKEATTFFDNMNPEHRKRISAIVPDNEDVPGIFVQTDEIATSNGMVLVSIDTVTDEKNVRENGLKVVRVAVNLAGGSYDQFQQFLVDIEQSLRISDIQTVSFTPGTGTYGLIMTTYFLDEVPIETDTPLELNQFGP